MFGSCHRGMQKTSCMLMITQCFGIKEKSPLKDNIKYATLDNNKRSYIADTSTCVTHQTTPLWYGLLS